MCRIWLFVFMYRMSLPVRCGTTVAFASLASSQQRELSVESYFFRFQARFCDCILRCRVSDASDACRSPDAHAPARASHESATTPVVSEFLMRLSPSLGH